MKELFSFIVLNRLDDAFLTRLAVCSTSDLDTPDAATGHTLLTFASVLGRANFVHALLERGCSVSALDGSGNSALKRAAERRHGLVVRELLAYDLDIFSAGEAVAFVIEILKEQVSDSSHSEIQMRAANQLQAVVTQAAMALLPATSGSEHFVLGQLSHVTAAAIIPSFDLLKRSIASGADLPGMCKGPAAEDPSAVSAPFGSAAAAGGGAGGSVLKKHSDVLSTAEAILSKMDERIRAGSMADFKMLQLAKERLILVEFILCMKDNPSYSPEVAVSHVKAKHPDIYAGLSSSSEVRLFLQTILSKSEKDPVVSP